MSREHSRAERRGDGSRRSALFRWLPVLCLAFLCLGGCTVHLVSAYDARTDEDLTNLNTDLTAFVITMVSESKTPQGEYDNNKSFYVGAQARLATIKLRAETSRALGACPADEVVRTAVLQQLPTSAPISAFPSTVTPSTILSQLPRGDCEVQLLQLVADGFVDLQRFHQAQGKLGIPPSARDPILIGGVGALLRAAIAVEMSKKPGFDSRSS